MPIPTRSLLPLKDVKTTCKYTRSLIAIHLPSVDAWTSPFRHLTSVSASCYSPSILPTTCILASYTPAGWLLVGVKKIAQKLPYTTSHTTLDFLLIRHGRIPFCLTNGGVIPFASLNRRRTSYTSMLR